MWPVYIISIPMIMVRSKLILIAKRDLSPSAIERLKKIRERL
jgi:hypothetical protein